jgi:hypothetical protein
MRIYRIPIKCTPQVSIIPASANIVEVVGPTRLGDIFVPELVVSCTWAQYACINSSSIGHTGTYNVNDFTNITITCVPIDNEYTEDRSCENYTGGATLHRLNSMLHNCTLPETVQQSRMRAVGSFEHYYNKRRYAVYIEDLTSSSAAVITPTGSSGQSRAISEGSLTRTIT